MGIIWKVNILPSIQEIIELYHNDTFNKRIEDESLIDELYRNSNLVVSLWDGRKLIAISRSITDYKFHCYLCDLSIHKEYCGLQLEQSMINKIKENIEEHALVKVICNSRTIVFYEYEELETQKTDNCYLVK